MLNFINIRGVEAIRFSNHICNVILTFIFVTTVIIFLANKHLQMVPGWLEVGKSSKDFLYLATVKSVFENTEEQISLLLEITFTGRSFHGSISNISVNHICVTAAHTSRCSRCGGSLGISMTVRHNIEHNWLLSRLKNIFHYLFFRLFIILHLHILMLNSLLSRTILIARKFLLKLIEPRLFFLFIS